MSAKRSSERVGYRNGVLSVEGVSTLSLARRFGTPLYAYSQGSLLDKLSGLRDAFAGSRETLICYALKANPTKGLCGVLAREGLGAEIVSGGELQRALRAGFKARRMVFSGVGKTKEELALALKTGLLAINVESPGELEALSRLARKYRRVAPVSVRLNPGIDAKTHSRITTGLSVNKFGVERGQALKMFSRARQDPWLKIVGIQCHIGSQIMDVGPFARAVKVVARLVRDLERDGVGIEWVDLGGGIGVSQDSEPEFDLKEFARTITEGLAGIDAKLIIEPGRYLVADSGVLLTKVLYRKETKRKRFVVVDAGQNDLARPSLYGAYHPIRLCAKKRGRENLETVDVVGPICESGDFLAQQRKLPRCGVGEILAVLKCGAYGSSMSSQYNSRPRAAEVLVKGHTVRTIRKRESCKDLTRLEE